MQRANAFGSLTRQLAWMGGAVGIAALAAAYTGAQEYLPGVEWPKPPIITPGKAPGDPPSDATILFDGKDLSAWENGENWNVEDGVATNKPGAGYIVSKQRFGDSQLHIEWSAPTKVEGEGQGRGNSGVFFGPYELQVLDSYENETYYDGQASAIYKQQAPMVNVMRKPGEWNTYDILWTAPRFKDGKLESPAYITVLHNGVATLNHFALLGDTPYNRPPQYNDQGDLPIQLQDHGNPVRFRNIWIRPLKPIVGKQVKQPVMRIGDKEIPVSATGKVAGKLTLGGRPVAGWANVTLHGDGADRTFASAVHDGKFHLGGVLPGKYAVSVAAIPGGHGAKIPESYGNAGASPIKCEIKTGDNEISLDLKPE